MRIMSIGSGVYKEVFMNDRMLSMKLSTVYPLLVAKAERKGRTKDEVDTIFSTVLGYDRNALAHMVGSDIDYGTFISSAPRRDDAHLAVGGSICGVRLESIEDDTVRRIRVLDKLVDDLAKGRPLERILAAFGYSV